ncbi:MAG: T9SS type A sorting domain-containing protein [Lentimicrobiaceae bacterium]|nr:T9SS type A sorting domain-containing protein [Lentimicrobiaceae bacterium]
MKKILTLLLVGITLFGYAQKFQLTDPKGIPYAHEQIISATVTGADLDFQGEYVTDIKIENLIGEEFSMRTFRTNDALIEGMTAYVCGGGLCYDSLVFAIDFTLMEEGDSYAVHLKPKGNFGLCKFKLDFMAEDQSMTLYVHLDVLPLGVQNHNDSKLSLSAFPNPANTHSTINVTYTLADKSINHRLVIRNIVGAEVISKPLNPYENTIAIETSPLVAGVYFYAIENKNQISIAKKLIVK